MDLQNKVVLVTGACGGIGSAVVKALAVEKAKVVIHYSRDPQKAAHLAKFLEDAGVEFLTVGADFRKEGEIAKMFADISRQYDKIDGLVNVSGIEEFNDDALDTSKWKDVFAIDLFGTVECSREALKMMEEGVIVNISSIFGASGMAFSPESLSYSVAKAAVNKFTEELAIMAAPKIRAVGILPGYVKTPLWDSFPEDETTAAIATVPIKRFIEPEEIAQAVLAVVHNNAITGQNIIIDGGLALKN